MRRQPNTQQEVFEFMRDNIVVVDSVDETASYVRSVLALTSVAVVLGALGNAAIAVIFGTN
jgi:hypothetical protein